MSGPAAGTPRLTTTPARLTTRSRRLAAVCLTTAAALLAPGRSGAQALDVPKRPRLDARADTNDWRDYYAYGMRRIARTPDEAVRAFYWAGRLNPLQAEPLMGEWVARWRTEPELFTAVYGGNGRTPAYAKADAIDSLYVRALERDPMVNRQLERLTYDMLPGEYGTDAMTQGMLSYARGDRRGALLNYARAFDTRREPTARYFRALTDYAAGDFEAAAAELAAGIARLARLERGATVAAYETKGLFGLALGNVLAKAGHPGPAREAYMRALSEDVSLAGAHVALADLAVAGGDAKGALDEYRQATEIRPLDGGIRFRYATALQAAGDLPAAEAEFRKALEYEPYFFATYLNLGTVLESEGQRAEADRAYAEFVARAPNAFAPQVAAVRRRLAAAGATR